MPEVVMHSHDSREYRVSPKLEYARTFGNRDSSGLSDGRDQPVPDHYRLFLSRRRSSSIDHSYVDEGKYWSLHCHELADFSAEARPYLSCSGSGRAR
jgi:hypothetical protein